MTPFAVAASLRTGSTLLIDTLGALPEVTVFDGPHAELLNPFTRVETAIRYGTALDERAIIKSFLGSCQTPFAGFKLFPNQMRDWRVIWGMRDLKTIVLTRRDLISQVASYAISSRFRHWQLAASQQTLTYTFLGEAERRLVDRCLSDILYDNACLAELHPVVRLTYEDLVHPEFTSPELDALFGQRVAIMSPREPISYTDYMTNPDEFAAHIRKRCDALGYTLESA
jgi:hypothetical protein